MQFHNDLIRKSSAEALCAHRDRAIEQIDAALSALAEASRAFGAATSSDGYLSPLGSSLAYSVSPRSVHGTGHLRETLRKHIDSASWRHVAQATGLLSYMDAESRKQFAKECDENPPPFTIDALRATFENHLAGLGDTLSRSIYNVFRVCDHKRYRSNQMYLIGPKIVLDGVLTPHGFNNHSTGRDTLDDIDRILHLLDDRPAPDFRGNIASQILGARRGASAGEVETEYMRVKFFKNGNVHVYFSRMDLIKRANQRIVEFCGPALAG